MLKINNKGFTLVEMLAVIVILGVLSAIMVPTVTTLIAKNKEDNYDNLEKSILSAAKVFISDYRYDIQLDSSDICDSDNDTRKISIITDVVDFGDDSKLTIKTLVDNGYLTTNSDGKILNPKDDSKHLDLVNSYVKVEYKCNTKDYDFILYDLKWE